MTNDFQLKAAWAAGIVDADGCIRIRRSKQGARHYYSLYIVVGQAGADCPAILTELAHWFGGAVEGPRVQKRQGRQPTWQWAVASAHAAAFLKTIHPHLIGKRDQADLALDYRDKAMGWGKGHLAEDYYNRLQAMKNYTVRKHQLRSKEA